MAMTKRGLSVVFPIPRIVALWIIVQQVDCTNRHSRVLEHLEAVDYLLRRSYGLSPRDLEDLLSRTFFRV